MDFPPSSENDFDTIAITNTLERRRVLFKRKKTRKKRNKFAADIGCFMLKANDRLCWNVCKTNAADANAFAFALKWFSKRDERLIRWHH